MLFILMLDSALENVTVLWLLASVVFPIILAVFIFRAAFQLRRLRQLVERLGAPKPGDPWSEPQDWVACP